MPAASSASPGTPGAPVARLLARDAVVAVEKGRPLTGTIEHFLDSKVLVITDEHDLITALTVPTKEVPVEHAALAADEVILKNWTDMRGVGQSLVEMDIVELTGVKVKVGMFGLEGLVARVI